MMRMRILLVLFVFTVLHLSVLPSLPVFGVRGDAMVALAVAGGLLGGAERGAVLGFVAGLVADLFLVTPLGLSALTLSLVGFGVGLLQEGIIRAAWWIPVVTAFAAGAAATVVWALAGAMVGQRYLVETRLLLVATVVGAFAALLAPLALKLVGWAFADGGTRRAFT